MLPLSMSTSTSLSSQNLQLVIVSFFPLTDLRRIEGEDVRWRTATACQESSSVLLSQTVAMRLPSLTFLGFLLQSQERFRHLDLLDVRQVVPSLTMKYDGHRIYQCITIS